MNLIEKMRYRPDIDGLRAIAVLAVLLFHAGTRCTGGYVGVDVFFVISGFLITSLIWNDLETGRFTFANFWERRARRILPALLVVTIATLVAGWFLLLPIDFKNLGQASAAQAVFAANIHYYFDSGYFSGAANEKPLLHTWSLAVEEQFYLVVPFLLWGVFHYMKPRGRASVISLLAVGFILSFALSIYGVARNPTAAFYLLPTRAWELLMGSLVAFLPTSPGLLKYRILRELFALMGLALIFIPIFVYTAETPFPGLAALSPCLGTALIIWANGRVDNKMPTLVGLVLSARPVVFIGLISYSLYLWHWPFFAFSKYLIFEPLSRQERALLLGLGFFFAILSWKYVETPFRERKIGASRKSIFQIAAAGLVVVIGCGLLCVMTQGFPQRFSPQSQRFASAKFDEAFQYELGLEDIKAGRLVPIGSRNSLLRPSVLVWGDSFAMAAMPAVDAFLKEKGIAGRAATHSLNAPVLGWSDPKVELKEDAIPFNDSVFSYIKNQRISDVIMIARWASYVEIGKDPSGTFRSSLTATIRKLNTIGIRPWLLLSVPNHTFDVPKALALPFYSQTYVQSICARPNESSGVNAYDPEFIAEIKAAGGRVLDPKPRFIDSTGEYYVIQADGFALYRDNSHLTTEGAKIKLLPLLRDSMKLKK